MKKLLVLFTALLFFKSAYCQDLNLFIKDLKEERHLDEEDSFLELEALVKGIKVDELHQIKIKELFKVEDDQGTTLKQKKSFFGDDYSSDSKLTLKLEAPSRNATKIKSISGVLSVFSPSDSNNSMLTFENLPKYYNKNLLKGKHSSVKLTLVNPSASEKSKKEAEDSFNKELEKAKEKGELEEGVAEVVNVMKGLFEGFSSFGSSEFSLSFIVEDEAEQIIEIVVLNEKGEKINYGTSKYGSTQLTINLEEQITDKSILKILIENKESVKTYSFKLNDILLP